MSNNNTTTHHQKKGGGGGGFKIFFSSASSHRDNNSVVCCHSTHCNNRGFNASFRIQTLPWTLLTSSSEGTCLWRVLKHTSGCVAGETRASEASRVVSLYRYTTSCSQVAQPVGQNVFFIAGCICNGGAVLQLFKWRIRHLFHCPSSGHGNIYDDVLLRF